MARNTSSLEKQIADKVVDRALSSAFGKGGRAKSNSAVLILLVLALIGGYIFKSSEDPNGESFDSPAASSGDVDGEYGVTNNDSSTGSDEPSDSSEPVDVSNGARRAVPDSERATIERCVDGDTLIVRVQVDGKELRERVRLIGANTPETVKKNHPIEPFGPEASAYTKQRVEEAGFVATLVRDGTPYDQYDRRLAVVYLGDDEISLNEDLARQGLAKVQTQYSYSKELKQRLLAAAQEAREEGIGIYSLPENQ